MNNKLKIGLLFLVVALIAAPGVSAQGHPGGTMPAPTSNTGVQVCNNCHPVVTFCKSCHVFPTFSLAVVANPTTVAADTLTSEDITVSGSNNVKSKSTPVSGATVTLTGPGVSTSGATDAAGIYTTNVNPTASGTINANATMTGFNSADASITVTAPAPTPVLTTITVTPATTNLLIGGTQVFTAVAKDQNGIVMTPVLSWTSSNGTVGTIDASGNFNALAEGTTTIKAANGTVNGTALVTVTTAIQTPVLTTIKVTPPTAKIIVGKNRSFMAKTFDQFNNKVSAIVTWTSSNETVGMIDASGKFRALAAGTTTIKAANGTINGTASVTVTTTVKTPVLKTIKITPPKAKIMIGKTRLFMAKTLDQFNHKIAAIVTWASSNTTVGTIDNNGKFTALSAGTTTLTATNGTINASATITVKANTKKNKNDKHELEEELDED